MEKTPAHDFLENLQREMYLALHVDPDQLNKTHSDVFEKVWSLKTDQFKELPFITIETIKKKYRQYFEKMLQNCPKYENAGNYLRLTNQLETIENILKDPETVFKNNKFQEKNSYKNISRPIFATIPSADINAFSIGFLESKENLVVLESDFFDFCHLFSKIIAMALYFDHDSSKTALPVTNLRQIEKNIEDNEIISEKFHNFIITKLTTGTVTLAKPYFVNQNIELIALSISKSIQKFALGHEYAHVLLGHLDQSSEKLPNQDNDAENDFNLDEEYDADELGLNLMIKAGEQSEKTGGMNYPQIYWGAECFFSVFKIIHRSKEFLGISEEDSVKSHPTSKNRQYKIREIMKHDHSYIDGDFHQLIEKSVDMLWDKIKINLDNHYKKIKNSDADSKLLNSIGLKSSHINDILINVEDILNKNSQRKAIRINKKCLK